MAPALRIGRDLPARSVAGAASELAQRQFGSIARRQLLEAGFTASRITDWIHAGRLFRRYPGVYAYGRPDLPEQGQLAAGLLYTGSGSGLDGLSALWWRGFLHRRPDSIHIACPGRTSSRQDLRIRHPQDLERALHRGLPLVPLPRALLIASEHLSHDSLRLVLGRAEFKQTLSLSALQAAIAGGPVGSRALKAAMDAHLPQLAKCANGFERGFVLLCEAHSLPIPDPNERVGRYRPDMIWWDAMLVVELDGKDGHTSAAQIAADERRQRWLRSRGYRVLRLTWAEVEYRPAWVVARVREALSTSA